MLKLDISKAISQLKWMPTLNFEDTVKYITDMTKTLRILHKTGNVIAFGDFNETSVEIPWMTELKLDGMDLSKQILHSQHPVERTLVWNGTTIRRGRWKYMASQKGLPADSLFDLTAEATETTNLIEQYPSMAQAFRHELDLWRSDMEKTETPQPTGPK